MYAIHYFFKFVQFQKILNTPSTKETVLGHRGFDETKKITIQHEATLEFPEGRERWLREKSLPRRMYG